jgi:hypothetical protein
MPSKFTPYTVVKTKTKYPSFMDSAEVAGGLAEATYPQKEQWQGKGDALRHLVWQALLAKGYNSTVADYAGKYHELDLGDGLRKYTHTAASDQTPEEKAQDLFNNALGREIASKAKNVEDIYLLAKEYVDSGKAKFLTPDELEFQSRLREAKKTMDQQGSPY